jgi:hypothetical protein
MNDIFTKELSIKHNIVLDDSLLHLLSSNATIMNECGLRSIFLSAFVPMFLLYFFELEIVFVVAILSFRIHVVPSPPDRSLQHRIDIMVLLDEIFYRLLHNIRISLQTMVSSNISLLFIPILNREHSHQPPPTVVPLGFLSHSRSFSSCGAL